MKNSNKLLVFLIALVFSIPLLMIMAFKNAINENNYVIKNSFGVKETTAHSLKPFKVAKLKCDPKNPLLCNIRSGEKYAFKLLNYNTERTGKEMPDHCKIEVVADTLFISYNAKDSDQHLLELDLIIPGSITIIAEGAQIAVDNFKADSSKNIQVDLSREAEFYVGAENNRYKSESELNLEKNYLSSLAIRSVGASVNIHGPAKIGSLTIEAGRSKISVDKNVVINSVSGSLTPETIVNAPYEFIGKLTPVKVQ